MENKKRKWRSLEERQMEADLLAQKREARRIQITVSKLDQLKELWEWLRQHSPLEALEWYDEERFRMNSIRMHKPK